MSLRLSLRSRTVLLSTIPGFIILLFAVVIWVYMLERASMDAVLKRDGEIARITAARLTESIFRYTLPLQNIASTLSVTDFESFIMPGEKDQQDIWSQVFDGGIHFYDAQGVHLDSTLKGIRQGQLVPQLPSDTRLSVTRKLTPQFTNILHIPETDQDIFMLVAPVIDADHQITGFVAGAFDLRHSLIELEYAKALDIKAGRGGYSYLVDGNGVVIHHRNTTLIGKSLAGDPLVDKARAGQTGALALPDEAGKLMISGYAPVEQSPWGLITRERWDVIVEPVQKYNRMLQWGTPILLFLTALILYLAMGRTLKPLRDLTEGAKRISQGRFDTVLDVHTGDEVADLAWQFNHMARKLQSSYSDLENRVDELNKLQNTLNSIINSMPSAIVGVDSNERVTHWNKRAEDTTGLKAEHMRGVSLWDMFPQFERELKILRKALEEQRIFEENRIPNPLTTEASFLDMTIYPLEGEGVEGAVIRMDDVTQKVRMEEMMIQSEKMLSIGGLAAGMAHEINNPLAGIIQALQVMQNRVLKDLPKNLEIARDSGLDLEKMRTYMKRRGLLEMMDTVQESSKRAAQIVQNMLSFSRKGDSRFEQHDMQSLMEKTVELASSEYNLKKSYDFRTINIVRDYEEELPPVWCEPGKIQQVLLNLFTNAAHALTEHENASVQPIISIGLHASKGNMVITVMDNGPGMDKETRTRIFEPFFTTKPEGVGTGLGLSVSYFIITEGHGGSMEVESEPGEGTRFVITLPLNRDVIPRLE